MEKDFVPYQESLEMKELGFDEPCFGCYEEIEKRDYKVILEVTKSIGLNTLNGIRNYNQEDRVSVPTFSQAFRWFREKYNLDCSFEDDMVYDENDNEIQMWDFFIYKTKQKSDNKVMDFCSNNFDTYIESFSREQAELECLRKLIEIVKEKQK